MTALSHQALKMTVVAHCSSHGYCCRPRTAMQAHQCQTGTKNSAFRQGKNSRDCPEVWIRKTLHVCALGYIFTHSQASVALLSVHASCAFTSWRCTVWIALCRCAARCRNLRRCHRWNVPRRFSGADLDEVVLPRSLRSGSISQTALSFTVACSGARLCR